VIPFASSWFFLEAAVMAQRRIGQETSIKIPAAGREMRSQRNFGMMQKVQRLLQP
jgi:hypothetical protein